MAIDPTLLASIDPNLLAELAFGYGAPPPNRRQAPAPVVRSVQPVTIPVPAPAPPVAPPTPQPQVPVVMPSPSPAIDRSLYQYIPTELPPGIDYKQFPVPQMPTYQQMPTMPQRQFQQEAAGAQKASLRAGLIGLLLGGGAGAVAAASGAQQAYQQNVQNQYEQALREYQNRANLTEMANAQAAQRYRDELAARQAAVGEAESTYRMEAGRLATKAENDRLIQQGQRDLQAAINANNIERANRIKDVLTQIRGGGFDAQTATALLAWAQTGDVSKLPTSVGLTAKLPPGSVAAAQKMLTDFASIQHTLTPEGWARRRNEILESLGNSPNDFIRNMASSLPTIQSKTPLTTEGRKADMAEKMVEFRGRQVKVSELGLEIRKDLAASTKAHRARMATIAEQRNAISHMRALKQPVSKTMENAFLSSVESNFKSMVVQLNAYRKTLTRPETLYVPAVRQAAEAAVARQEAEIEQFAKDNSAYFTYTPGQVPTLVRKRAGVEPPPKVDNPTPKPRTGVSEFSLGDGNKVRLIR